MKTAKIAKKKATTERQHMFRIRPKSIGPDGCLECNTKEVVRWLGKRGSKPQDFTNVAIPIIPNVQVMSCSQCGLHWMFTADWNKLPGDIQANTMFPL